MKFANVLFGLAYVLSVVVQYNDPDPLLWMLLYGAAAAVCLAWALQRCPRWLPAAVLAIAVGWSGWIAVNIELGVPLTEALGDWGMHGQGSEEAREIGGLLLVGVWMLVLALKPSAPPADAPSP